ncbi:hypothetical protein ACFQGT_09050 [Natrialbaceae archaeon GCM10025810]|uniref:hypothetical protein n=1 Tax=Halovalidus salilacus TaxID=3075124 RepID=UPI003614DB60
MSVRTALRQNPVFLVAFILVGLWLIATVVDVLSSMGSFAYANWVGQSGTAGVIGVAVLGVVGLYLLLLFANLGQPDPVPDRFPPEE